MEGKVVKGNRITEGSIFGQLLLFFFPILFGTFFQQLYNTADAMVVGRFVGKQALAAVGGSTSTLINLLWVSLWDCPAAPQWSYPSFTAPGRRIRSTGPYIHPLLFPLLGALSL